MLPLATGEGMDEGGNVPLTDVAIGATEVSVGNPVAVKIPGTGVAVMVGVPALVAGVDVLGVPVFSGKSPGGVEVGFGFGGFCQTKTNPPIRMQSPKTPQPRPLNKNLSNVATSFLVLDDFIVSTNSKA